MSIASSPSTSALVFDLDGTLVDSAPDLCHAINTILRENGCAPLPLEQVIPMVGDGVATLLRRALTAAGVAFTEESIKPLVAHFQDVYFQALCVDTKPYPGVVDTLKTLQAAGWKMAVCTNKPQRHSVRLLEDIGLAPFFSAVFGGDAAPVRKPDPGHVLATLQALGCSPERAVMIGDSNNDIYAGRDAGARTIAFSYGYGASLDSASADAVLDHFADLPKTLESL